MSSTVTDDIAVAPDDGPVEAPARRYRGGWRIVARKEFADHVHSARFVILIILLALAGLASVHSASGPIRDAADKASSTPSIFLYLFTLSPDRVPSFYEFIGILGPLLGIAFGFDAINGERSLGTLPRLVAQPIHRDEIINGKFVAGIGAIALGLGCLITMVGGYGALRLGVGPTWSDVIRLIAYFAVAVVYISLWLALAILLSVTCRRAATAALAALAVWLVLTLFAGLIAGIVADSWHKVDSRVDDRGGARQRPHRAERPAALTRPAVQGCDRRPAQPVAADDRDRHPAARGRERGDGHRRPPVEPAAVGEPGARLVAARRPRRRHDRRLRRCLPGVPPPGGAGIATWCLVQ